MSASYLNELGGQHWRRFASQNYFDSHGLFVSLVFSCPLLLLCLLIVVNSIFQSGSLLVQLKRKELKNHTQQQQKVNNMFAAHVCYFFLWESFQILTKIGLFVFRFQQKAPNKEQTQQKPGQKQSNKQKGQEKMKHI